jgi:ribosomal protein S18 acetylase RimI-like enzyme
MTQGADGTNIRMEHRPPTAEEHRHLAVRVGWEHGFNWEVLPASLAASLGGIVALDGNTAIGMGRIVGDGAMYFYIQDVAVDPAYQGRGIGQRIVDALMQSIRDASSGPVFVGLFATDAALPLYERNGFSKGDMTGMFQVVEPHARERE